MSRATPPAEFRRTPPAPGQLKITIADSAETAEALADLSADLRDRLRWLHVDRVTRALDTLPAPAGTFAVDITAPHTFLVELTASVTLVRQVIGVLLDWQQLRKTRSVVVEIPGRKFTLDADAPKGTAKQVESLLASFEATGRPHTGRRLALLIANSTYADPQLRPLYSPVADAERLAEALAGLGDFEVEVVLDQESHEIKRRIVDALEPRSRDDLVLLYYSGHGLLDAYDALYLAARDSQNDQLFNSAVAASFLREQMSHSGAGSVVLMLDCCYAGAFTRASAEVGAQLRDPHGGGRSRVVITSATAVQLAHEDKDSTGPAALEEERGYRSWFAEALIDTLLTGQPDQNGWIGHFALFEQVQERLKAMALKPPRHVQSPDIWAAVQHQIHIARVPGELFPDIGRRLTATDDDQRRLAVLDLKWIARAEPSPPAWAARAVLRRVGCKDQSPEVRREAQDALGNATIGAIGPDLPPPPPRTDVDPHHLWRGLAGVGALTCALRCLSVALDSSWGVAWTWPFLVMALLLIAGTAALFMDRTVTAPAGVLCAVLVVQLAAQLTAAEYALSTGGRDWMPPWYRADATGVVTDLAWTALPILILTSRWLARGTRWRVDRRTVLATLGLVVAAALSSAGAAGMSAGASGVGIVLRAVTLLTVSLVVLRPGPQGRLGRWLAGGVLLGLLAVLPGFPAILWPLPYATVDQGTAAVSAALIGLAALTHGFGPFGRHAGTASRAVSPSANARRTGPLATADAVVQRTTSR
jgi:hypothetical protein